MKQEIQKEKEPSQNKGKKIVIIDGYHLLHKGYYGSLKRKKIQRNNDGELLNAVYVFVAKMLELADSGEYHTIIVTFDVNGENCWRRSLYPGYKATRKETPEDLKPQMQLVREFLTAANIPWYEKNQYEGDDLMGTIARIANKLGYFVEIVSNDKDTYQLINDKTTVMTQKTSRCDKEYISKDDVIEDFGCTPNQIPDIKSLMGDSSDNIKGVRGLHYSTATKILKKFKCVEECFKHIEDLEEKHQNLLLQHKEQILVNKKIATIQRNVNVGRIDFRPLNINYVGFMWFIRKQKMWSFARRIQPLAQKQIDRRDELRAKKTTGTNHKPESQSQHHKKASA